MATFVLVHGSMHGGWCWKRLVPLLRAAGHEVFAPTLTGLGERVHLAHPGIDLDTHVRDVLGVVEYEDLDDVVLVGHSYGTMVVAGVADRVPDRIAHFVNLDGPVPDDGQALLDFFRPEGQVARHARVAAGGDGWRLPPADPAAFGIERAADAAWVRAKLAPQPFGTMTQPLRLANPAGFAGPKTFIACDAPAVDWREAAVERVRAEPGWRYRELATGHDAMITAPGQLVDLLLEIAQPAPEETGLPAPRGVAPGSRPRERGRSCRRGNGAGGTRTREPGAVRGAAGRRPGRIMGVVNVRGVVRGGRARPWPRRSTRARRSRRSARCGRPGSTGRTRCRRRR